MGLGNRVPILAKIRALLALLAAGLLLGFPVVAAADPITLRLHTSNPPNSIAVTRFLRPWAVEVEEKSGGRVRIEVFPAMQLGGRPADLYGQARDGVVDIVWTLPGYTPGRFPLTEVFELPFVCGEAEATSQALTEFHREWLRDEYSDTRPLVFHATAPGHIHTADRRIRALEDMAGAKIRAATRVKAEMLETLGAVPVGMPVADVYEAISRGVVEGAWVPWTIMRPARLHEVTNFHTEISLSCTLFVMTMNKARYEGLPAAIRAVIDETTGTALAGRLGRLWQEDEKPGRDMALEQGDTILPLSGAERERWRAATSGVTESWIEMVDAGGRDGEAMLADALRLVAEYSDEPRH